jgi:hypothetical protein
VRAVRSASPSPSGPARTVPLGRELGAVWADTRHSGTAVQRIRGRHDERPARCEASRKGGSAPAASKRHTPIPTSATPPAAVVAGATGLLNWLRLCLWTSERTQTPNLLIRSYNAPLLMAGIQAFHRAPESPQWASRVMVCSSSWIDSWMKITIFYPLWTRRWVFHLMNR